MIPGNPPSKFIDFSISLNGQGYLGRCNYIELPKLKKKTDKPSKTMSRKSTTLNNKSNRRHNKPKKPRIRAIKQRL